MSNLNTELWRKANPPAASRAVICIRCNQTVAWVADDSGRAHFGGLCPPCWFRESRE